MTKKKIIVATALLMTVANLSAHTGFINTVSANTNYSIGERPADLSDYDTLESLKTSSNYSHNGNLYIKGEVNIGSSFTNKGNVYIDAGASNIDSFSSTNIEGDLYIKTNGEVDFGNNLNVSGNIYIESSKISVFSSTEIGGDLYIKTNGKVDFGNNLKVAGSTYISSGEFDLFSSFTSGKNTTIIASTKADFGSSISGGIIRIYSPEISVFSSINTYRLYTDDITPKINSSLKMTNELTTGFNKKVDKLIKYTYSIEDINTLFNEGTEISNKVISIKDLLKSSYDSGDYNTATSYANQIATLKANYLNKVATYIDSYKVEEYNAIKAKEIETTNGYFSSYPNLGAINWSLTTNTVQQTNTTTTTTNTTVQQTNTNNTTQQTNTNNTTQQTNTNNTTQQNSNGNGMQNLNNALNNYGNNVVNNALNNAANSLNGTNTSFNTQQNSNSNGMQNLNTKTTTQQTNTINTTQQNSTNNSYYSTNTYEYLPKTFIAALEKKLSNMSDVRKEKFLSVLGDKVDVLLNKKLSTKTKNILSDLSDYINDKLEEMGGNENNEVLKDLIK